ncbi:hypothetical protein Leryth_011247, partial [Lithospermum erythrorhizon]
MKISTTLTKILKGEVLHNVEQSFKILYEQKSYGRSSPIPCLVTGIQEKSRLPQVICPVG